MFQHRRKNNRLKKNKYKQDKNYIGTSLNYSKLKIKKNEVY